VDLQQLGAGTAAGSFGQFLFAPFGVALIDNFGWQSALTVFAPGALSTAMPRWVAAATSTLSTPTPARPITCSSEASAIRASVT
jgi:hypothetical protein